MCRVKSFLGCASLKSFGIVYGWINLVILIIFAIIAALACFVAVYKRHGQYALICLLIFAFLAFSIFITHQFIEGIEKHNHNQMSVYRIFAIIAAILAPLNLIVKFVKLGQYDRHQVHRDPTGSLLGMIFFCILDIYFCMCINSLYLDIKEANSTVIPTNRVKGNDVVGFHANPPPHNVSQPQVQRV